MEFLKTTLLKANELLMILEYNTVENNYSNEGDRDEDEQKKRNMEKDVQKEKKQRLPENGKKKL